MDIYRLRQLLPESSADEPIFVSTRDSEGKNCYQWNTVLEMGLSPDYGLFMPAALPYFSEESVNNLSNLTYPELA